jgi:hypothetical protein
VKKLVLLAAFTLFSAAALQLHAQSVRNTNWKTFIVGLNDTAVLHIYTDSSMVTNNSGAVLVRSVCSISGDTLSFKDYDGQFTCPDQNGVYKIHVDNAQLTLSVINDPCDGRLQSIDGIKWIKASK